MVDVFNEIKDRLVFMLQRDETSVTKCSRLSEDLGCDRIDLNELVFECEEEFGIEIPESALAKFVTVGDAVAFMEACLAKANRPLVALG